MGMTQMELEISEVLKKYRIGAFAIVILSEDGEGALAASVDANTPSNLSTLFHLIGRLFFGKFATLSGLPHYASIKAMLGLLEGAEEEYVERMEEGRAQMDDQISEELRGIGRPPPQGDDG